MKVAYVISSDNSRTILRDMIVPQMESKDHGAEVVGMFLCLIIHIYYWIIQI